jgi:putative ABC transport system substrate-binding protein
VAVEYHWMEGRFDRAPAMVAELIRRQVAVIFANTPGNLAAKAATTAIPIVFATGGDPVQMGLVASLSRPGGNVTGVTQMNAEVSPKRLGLAHELVPTATTVAILVNPASPIAEPQVTELQVAARTLGLQLHVLHASTERDFDTVFATLAQQRAGPFVISADSFFNSRSKLLGELTLRHAVPAIYEDRAFAAAGGLMTYGGRTPDMYRIAGAYTGRILKGERPADLPVQQGTRVELIINVKTAKVLGLSIPLPLLARADEVIE